MRQADSEVCEALRYLRLGKIAHEPLFLKWVLGLLPENVVALQDGALTVSRDGLTVAQAFCKVDAESDATACASLLEAELLLQRLVLR